MLLAAIRLPLLACHLLTGLGVALVWSRLRPRAQEAVVSWWARALLARLGVRLHVIGSAHQDPALIVANHVSWLDVAAIAAVQPAAFVCKSEIAGWPAIGWLLTQAGTIFIRRGSLRDVWRVNLELRARFMRAQSVAAFPEGTTTAGSEVLPFRPGLFQPAVERGIPVQPMAIAYSNACALFVGETSFLQSLLAIAAARRLEVRIALLRPLATAGLTRRAAAKRARDAIAACALSPHIDTDQASRRRRLPPARSTIVTQPSMQSRIAATWG